MRVQEIELRLLCRNKGQVEGLPKNPRFIRDEKFELLKKSIQENPEMLGLRELIVYPVGERYVIIGGNMRYEACKALGYQSVPCKVLDADTPVETLKAYTIKDNAGFGEWDWDAIANEWDTDEVTDWGLDVPEWETDEETQQEAEEDDFDEAKDEIHAKVTTGDIWQLGEHRLMCGDSIKREDLARLMDGAHADIFITDPPYGVSYTEKNEFLNSIGKPLSCINAIQNDSKTPEEMKEFWVAAFSMGFEFTKDKMSYYITAPQGGDLLLLLLSVREAGFALKHSMVWAKNNHVLGRCDYNYKHEPIIYGWKQKGTHSFYGKGQFTTSVWNIDKPLRNEFHPTMKPIPLIENMLLNNTREGESALDLFGGSGTTLIACEQLNRKCYMMEIDPHYCDVIIARWEKLTGKKAIKL